MSHSKVVSVSNSASPLPLLANEQIIFRVKPNFIIPLSFILLVWAVGFLFWWFFVKAGIINFPSSVSASVLTIIIIAVFGFVGLVIFLNWLNTEYILTNERVEWRFGIIGEGTVSIALDKIQNIVLKRGLLGMIFNFGNIKIEPAGLTASINFGGISGAKQRKEQIEAAI